MMLLAIIAALGLEGPASGGCLTVDGEWITAGDVAALLPRYDGADPGLRLVRAPFPGATRVVGPASLPGAGDAGAKVPFCVERRLRKLSREAFTEAVKQSLPSDGEFPISFDLVEYDQSMLPSGKLEFPARSLPPPIFNRTDDPVLWRGKLYYGQGRSVPAWVRVRLWIEGEVCVLSRDVARGADLSAEDCKLAKAKYPPFSPPPVRDAKALEHTAAARTLKAGEPVDQALLVRIPEVEAGRQVQLKVVNGGAQLRFQAKASSSGRRGDSVTVTNPANGKRLEGQVVGQGSVEVHLK